MKKFKQCTYTMILIFTCLIASPMIFKQIWTTSAEKKKENKANIEDIDIRKGYNDGTETPSADASVPGTSGNAAPQTPSAGASEPISGDVLFTPPSSESTTAVQSFSFVPADYSYFDNALFIGDSRTVGIRDYGSLGNADFFCREGLSTNEAKNSSASSGDGDLGNMLSSGKYKKIYIMLGINEIGNDYDSTFANYRALLENVRAKAPDAVVYLQANMHVTYDAQTSSINNERINELNRRISSLADNSKVFYIDINPVFDDKDGNLEAGYTSDGVHVLGAIYQNWSEWYCLYTVPGT